MLYRKIRVSQLDDTKKLYRVMFVPEDISLRRLASVIVRAFRGNESVSCRFESGSCWYSAIEKETAFHKPMNGVSARDLGPAFRFQYDYDEEWQFEVRLLEETQEFDSDLDAIVTEGKGAGIWEDDRTGYKHLLSAVCQGKAVRKKDFRLPYNLDLAKAADTFDEIDPVSETERMAEDPYSEEDADMYENSIWEKFNELFDNAEMAFMENNSDGKIWLETWAEFKRVCEQLKEEGRLPDTWNGLVQSYDDFEGWNFPDSLADELPDYGLGEELWQIMNELETMFKPEGEFLFDVFRGKWEALCELDRDEELLLLSRDMYRKYPDHWTVRIYMLKAYDLHDMHKEGLALIRDVLKKEGDECNEDNIGFFEEAAEFADSAGDGKLAAKLGQAAEDEFMREQGEPDEDYFWEDEEAEEENEELLEQIGAAVKRFCARAEKEDMVAILGYLTILAVNGGDVYVPFKEGYGGGFGMASGDGKNYLIIYTDPDTELPPTQEMRSIPFDVLVEEAQDEMVEGMIIDPLQSGQYHAVISREMLDLLRKTAGLDDSDED